MYGLPTSLNINGREMTIRNKGDFRMVIDCFNALDDEELSKEERIFSSLIIFFEDINSLEDVLQLTDLEDVYKEMIRFFNCGDTKEQGLDTNFKVMDWEYDSSIICAAINKVAGKEIRAIEYMHWWTFMGYYLEVGESLFSTVVRIRYKTAKHEKLEDYEKKFRNNNPHYFNFDMRTTEQKVADEEIRSLWNAI